MAKEDGEWDLERGPRPVVAVPPANGDARPRPAAVAVAGEDQDDDEESGRMIPSCVWVSLQLLLTAMVCCPLLALALTRTDWVEKAVLAVLMLPLVAGVFFGLHAVCERPRMSIVVELVKRRTPRFST